MRVLHLYSGNLFGGIERMLLTLQQHCDLQPEMTHQYALCFEGRLSRELIAAGGDVKLLGGVRASRPWTLWSARRKLANLLRSERPDVVVAHAWWSSGVFGPVVKTAGIPLVLIIHDVPSGKHWVERWAQRSNPDGIIANSRYTLSESRALFPNVPAKVCYPMVHRRTDNDRDAVRAEFGAKTNEVVIVITCRYERYKGHSTLIEALERLKDQPNWVCWIPGAPQRPHEQEYQNELMRSVNRLGIESRVKFLEHSENVPRLLSGVDIHCQPNIGPEAFGISFVEAMHAGLPVVTSDLGGGAEVVSDAGCLVPPGNVGELAGALRRLIEDPAVRESLGQKAKIRAGTRFLLSRSMRCWEKTLHSILQRGRPRTMPLGEMVPA